MDTFILPISGNLSKITSSHRRGFVLALGHLPGSLLDSEARLSKVVDAVLKNSTIEEEAVQRDPETRRNAVLALSKLSETIDNQGNSIFIFISISISYMECELLIDSVLLRTFEPILGVMAHGRRIFEALLVALEDYSKDNRYLLHNCKKEHGSLMHLTFTLKKEAM